MKYPISLFWNIGKMVYDNQDVSENPIQKYSNYYSYFFGNSFLFTRENVHLMKKLYLTFPIFYKRMEDIDWNQYQLLLSIPSPKERYFYFSLSLLFHSNYQETFEFIQNKYYSRI